MRVNWQESRHLAKLEGDVAFCGSSGIDVQAKGATRERYSIQFGLKLEDFMGYPALGYTWYRAYCTAMLNADEKNLLEAVTSARQAIQDRATELDLDRSICEGDGKQLQEALHYLTLLEDSTAKEGGKLLWC